MRSVCSADDIATSFCAEGCFRCIARNFVECPATVLLLTTMEAVEGTEYYLELESLILFKT